MLYFLLSICISYTILAHLYTKPLLYRVSYVFSFNSSMASLVTQWFNKVFSNAQLVVLIVLLVAIVIVLNVASDILTPLIIALVLAYILDGAVDLLKQWNLSSTLALTAVYLLFIGIVLFILVVLLPLMTVEITDFLRDLPAIASRGQNLLLQLPQTYPELIEERQITSFIASLREEIADVGQSVLSTLLVSIQGFITVLVYLVLVPLLVFFFLKDKDLLLGWVAKLLPRKENRALTTQVWQEANQKVSNYIRGKLLEIMIVWVVSWIVFAALGLNYAPLLSFLVGISVIVPFLGAAVITLPVAMVAYAQWGLSAEFVYLMIAYTIIQFLDGNLLVPFLFSEVVNLHPVAIISAILIFGGIWGVWGVFFAIPLATVVNAVLKAWPREPQLAS